MSSYAERVAELVARSDAVKVVAVEALWQREHVTRLTFDDGLSVVVKRPRAPSREGTSDDERLSSWRQEWAALAALADADSAVAVRLLAADEDTEVLVLEDLGSGASLAHLLLEEDAATAREALVLYAEALAGLHAAGRARIESYRGFRVRGRELTFDPDEYETAGPRWAALVTELTSREILGFDTEWATVREILDDERSRTIVHGDPCPDNVRFAEGALRIFDFESARLGSLFIDASYFVAPFPTCWCMASLPAPVISAAEIAYRNALAGAGGPLFSEGAWNAGIVAALARTVVMYADVTERVLTEDWRWGTTTVAPRLVQWLTTFAERADDADLLPVIRDSAIALRGNIVRACGGEPLGTYPAFAAAGQASVGVPDWWPPR